MKIFRILALLLLLLPACQSPEPSHRENPEIPLASPPSRTLNAGFLIVDGVYNSELFAPYDILHHTIFHADSGIRVFTVAPDSGPITTFEGNRLLPDYTFADVPAIDILVVPSAEHSLDLDLEDTVLINWVREAGSQAQYLMSLCDGAFVLARAGLLDGLHTTTFPADIPKFRERFGDRLTVEEGVSFVHHGKAITSNGGAKSYDPAMYLVHHLYGEKAATGVGRGMVIKWPEEIPDFLVFE